MSKKSKMSSRYDAATVGGWQPCGLPCGCQFGKSTLVCNRYKTVTKRLQTLQKLQNADPVLHFGRGRYLEVLTASGDLAMRLAVAAPAVGNIANTGGVGAGDRTLGFERLPRVLGWYPEAHPRLKSCPISPSLSRGTRGFAVRAAWRCAQATPQSL